MTAPSTDRERQFAALQTAASNLHEEARGLPYRDPAREAIRQAQIVLRQTAAKIAGERPALSPELSLGRVKNGHDGSYSLTLNYRWDCIPPGHDGYIGHVIRLVRDDRRRSLVRPPTYSYQPGDWVAMLRHEDAVWQNLGERGLVIPE